MNYDWLAALVFLGTLLLVTVIGRFLAFKVPALQRMRELNHDADRQKLARKRYRKAVKVNNKAALITNLVFYFAILPFCVNLEPRPIWRHLVDIVAVLMVFDFFYYLTHRFIFHNGPLRKVHALHHQARTPTYMDALFVHPVETTIGLGLFLSMMPLFAIVSGSPLSVFSMVIATLIFTQVNTLNHTYVNLPYFPFKTLDYMTSIHAAHHVDINCGNFATLTMIYDWLFGTLEKPVSRSAP
ncbi:MAG: sterol desaturase family protein [Deltaproteobacteria bacterium]|nr:sterol desaturase family protein [Deltaproteobacteria bacterium]